MLWFLAHELRGKPDGRLTELWKFGGVTVNWTDPWWYWFIRKFYHQGNVDLLLVLLFFATVKENLEF